MVNGDHFYLPSGHDSTPTSGEKLSDDKRALAAPDNTRYVTLLVSDEEMRYSPDSQRYEKTFLAPGSICTTEFILNRSDEALYQVWSEKIDFSIEIRKTQTSEIGIISQLPPPSRIQGENRCIYEY
jgi:hypothetical protein